jgi:predicted secreted protein
MDLDAVDHGHRGRSTTGRRAVLTSGLAVAALAIGAGATWASNVGNGTPGGASASGPGASVTTPAADPAGGSVEVSGPDGLPTTPVKVEAGGRLVVRLTEQAGSTGYSWAVGSTPGFLRLAGDTTVPASDPMPGAPGEHVFTFQVARAGTGTLSFALRRPWESGAAARTADLIVTTTTTTTGGDGTAPPPTTTTTTPAPSTTPAEPSPTTTRNPDPSTPAPSATVVVRGPDGLPAAVSVLVGGRLVVRLSEQAGSTGYSWAPRSVPKGLRLVGNRVIAATGGMPGAPGERVLTFAVTRAGTAKLSFVLVRPWSPDAPAKTVSLTVTAAS